MKPSWLANLRLQLKWTEIVEKEETIFQYAFLLIKTIVLNIENASAQT